MEDARGSARENKMPKNEETSWVFANCKHNINTAINHIKRLPTVESVTPVTGRFDLVIKLGTNSPAKAFNTVEKIRGISGVTSTQTAISFQAISNGERRESERESPLGFTLLKVKGKVQSILQRLKSIPNFVEAHIIPGEFDVLASFKGYGPEELAETTVGRINSLNGITTSETLVAYTPTNTTTNF